MGTAGPLAIARKLLDDGSGEPFFMLNADVICEYPLREALEYHKSHGGEATILVTKVRTTKHTPSFVRKIPSSFHFLMIDLGQ